MKKSILNITGTKVLTKNNQKEISGGALVDLSLCGCDCAARITGPKYCPYYMACLDVYTCDDLT